MGPLRKESDEQTRSDQNEAKPSLITQPVKPGERQVAGSSRTRESGLSAGRKLWKKTSKNQGT